MISVASVLIARFSIYKDQRGQCLTSDKMSGDGNLLDIFYH
jgi:hypothetical protein